MFMPDPIYAYLDELVDYCFFSKNVEKAQFRFCIKANHSLTEQPIEIYIDLKSIHIGQEVSYTIVSVWEAGIKNAWNDMAV